MSSDRITIRLPLPQIQDMDALVSLGQYATRTEVIRAALRLFLEQEGGRAQTTIESAKGMQELKKLAAQLQTVQAQMKGLGVFDEL